ncbi:MAG: thioesterase [Anaerolineales bacterium]|nr:thioesterase [Anaerolineales bacterium]
MTDWIARPFPNMNARLRLFCLPYAGGGTAVYHPWGRQLPAEVELCPIRLPGREGRIAERPYDQLLPLVDALAQAIFPYLEKPFALFGHSMGALLSFELARALRRRYGRLPAHLFVSGSDAPDRLAFDPPLHTLPDPEFVAQVRDRYKGLPDVIWQNAGLMQTFLPALRADFTLIETYTCRPDAPLGMPITTYGGEQDPETSRANLAAWRSHTDRAFSLKLFPGDHFFIQSAQPALLQALSRDLARYLK